jgi:hypothetical protein
MRGIDRVLAVLLLLGAVGGAAAFARQTGSGATSLSVDLAEPPLQHVDAPGTFFVAPALNRPAKAPAHRVTIQPATPEAPAQTLEPQGTPHALVAQPPAAEAAPPPVAAAPAPAPPAPPPAQAPVPAPVQTPEPPRVLAVAQPAAEPQTSKKHKGHGHAWGHVEREDTAPGAPTPEAPVAPTDVPVVPVSPDDSSGDEQGNGSDEQGERGKDNGNGHGHGSGHEQGGDQKHSGD